jgi:hypothetical protein
MSEEHIAHVRRYIDEVFSRYSLESAQSFEDSHGCEL